ncbi:MAG: tetratricopeptide repeat protein [Rikenellaceae bacterium]
MKKFVLIFAAAFMLCSTATMAQKVDLEGIISKMEKADADVANPKKGSKASTWISRGDAYVNSITAPTEALFVGMESKMVLIACGSPSATGNETINGKAYETATYPYFTIYYADGKVVGWSVDKIIRKGALDVAIESYNKAVEMDGGSATKVKASLDVASNYYKVMGNIAVELGDMTAGAEAFSTVAALSELEVNGGKADPAVLFYAGYMLTVDGNENPESFVQGEELLKKSLANGYCELEDANTEMEDSGRGNLYYYLYSCAYGQREGNSAKLNEAKGYLVEGIDKYPANERIFEGLMQLYTNEEGMGDPAELLVTVDKAIAKNAQDRNAWFSRGRIYYAMKNYDECIASFVKVTEIDPTFFEGNFFLGLFYMLKADNMLDEINAATYTDQSKYNADIESLNDTYAESIPCFEAAYEIKPTDRGTLEYLKQLCFRLRDMPGVMDKYTKYNELLNALPQ